MVWKYDLCIPRQGHEKFSAFCVPVIVLQTREGSGYFHVLYKPHMYNEGYSQVCVVPAIVLR